MACINFDFHHLFRPLSPKNTSVLTLKRNVSRRILDAGIFVPVEGARLVCGPGCPQSWIPRLQNGSVEQMSPELLRVSPINAG
jgi:hypothetical protein